MKKINNLILELNSVCNNNCSYCYLKNKKDEGKNSFGFFKNKIIQFSKKGIKNIDFTGGEPTLSPLLIPLIRLAKKTKYARINLITNGRRLAYEDYCRRVIGEGINRIVISLDGPNKEITEKITRTKGSFNQTIKGMQNVKKFDCELGATIVINKQNYKFLPEIVEKCISLNTDFINLQYILPFIKDEHIDCKKIPPEIIPTYKETLEYLKKTLNFFEKKIKINIHFIPPCYLKGNDKNILGDSSKQDRYAFNYRGFGYNIGDHLLKDCVKTAKCTTCEYSERCGGFFKSYAKELGIEKEINKKITKTLFFKNLFNSYDGKENNEWFHQATLYLASSFKKKGFPIVICNSKFSIDNKGGFLTKIQELEKVLKENPEINLIAITLLEDCFDKTKELISYIRKKTNAYIALGGIMPTLSPKQVFEHLPEANIVIRGEGEEIFPKIKKILEGKYSNEKLKNSEKVEIKKLRGVILRNKYEIIHSDDQSKNIIENLDNSSLDFSLLKKENISKGINLSTSRGCNNNCFFCTMPFKGKYRAKTIENIKKSLEDYQKRLNEIYLGKEIPKEAFNISFNDDDFLGDRERAISFFKFIKQTNFKINFIQAAINSFFIKKEGKYTEIIDKELINSMDPKIFYLNENKNNPQVYIGTENFCNDELNRLGKGYNLDKILKVIDALSNKKINQAHHLIITNTDTTLDNIFENLIKISRLKIKYGEYFNLLIPVISNLVSLYPSKSYKTINKKYGLVAFQIKDWLKSKESSELDYPFIEKDLPIDIDVRNIANKSANLVGKKDNYVTSIENSLIYLLNTLEKIKINNTEKERILKLEKIIEKYKNYTEQVREGISKENKKLLSNNQRNNLQIMLTRRCPLRCSYCPIPKKDTDMDIKTLKKAIELLFTSKQKEVRVDFTGGEPLLRFDLMKEGIEYAMKLAKEKSKNVSFYIVTNAIELSKEITNFLDGKNVLLELSIDGNEKTHNMFKIPINKQINPYKITTENAKYTLGKKIDKYVVLVSTPETANELFKSFKHIIELGFKKIEINYAIGRYWDKKSREIFFLELKKIINEFKKEIKNKSIEIGNFHKRKEPAILNSEFMIDTDGSINLLNEFLYKSKIISKSPYKFGSVYTCGDINKLYTNKFMIYYSLVRMFSENDLNIRKIIDNNLSMGLLCKFFFKSIKEDLK